MDIFLKWHREKQIIHKNTKIFYPKIRQIWYAKIGINVGFEANGKSEFSRPVLVLAKIGSLYWVAPLTSKNKLGIFYYELKSVFFKGIEHSCVMCSQARVIDQKRFQERIGDMISKDEFRAIQKKMSKLYFPSP